MGKIAAGNPAKKQKFSNQTMPEADPWKDAQETKLSEGVLLQFVGLTSPTHTLFVRILIPPSSPAERNHIFSVQQVLEWMLGEMLQREQAKTQEEFASQQLSSRQLLELGSVWKLSSNCSSGGTGKMKRVRQFLDNANDPLIVGTESLRVHFRPSRFPSAKLVDWTLSKQVEESSSTALATPKIHKGILHHDNDLGFAIVHKPSGLPAHATVDNGVENVLYQVEHHQRILGQGTLYKCSLPHRLDIETEGLLIVATKPEFSSYMGRMLQQKSLLCQANNVHENHHPVADIHKQYRCLVRLADPQQREDLIKRKGLIEHYRDPKSLAPKSFQLEAQEGWLKCLLRILEVGPVMTYQDNKAKLGSQVMEVQLELLTGRTHQIRGQFAAMNLPLVGDPLYGSPGTRTGCTTSWYTRRHRGSDDMSNTLIEHEGWLLGLQCCTLRFPKPKWQIHEKKQRLYLVEDGRELCSFLLDKARWSIYLTDTKEQGKNIAAMEP